MKLVIIKKTEDLFVVKRKGEVDELFTSWLCVLKYLARLSPIVATVSIAGCVAAPLPPTPPMPLTPPMPPLTDVQWQQIERNKRVEKRYEAMVKIESEFIGPMPEYVPPPRTHPWNLITNPVNIR